MRIGNIFGLALPGILFALTGSSTNVVAVDSEIVDYDYEDLATVPEQPPTPPQSNFKFSLRGAPSNVGSSLREVDLESIQRNVSAIAEMPDRESYELLESFQATLVKAVDELSSFNLSGITNDMKLDAETSRASSRYAIQVVEDAVKFLKPILLEERSDELSSNNAANSDADAANASHHSHHMKVERGLNIYGDEEEPEHEHMHSYNHNRNHKSNWKQNSRNDRYENSHHYKYGGESFHAHSNSHHARAMDEILAALRSGNPQAAFSAFGPGKNYPSGDGSGYESRRRRMRENMERRLSKWDQCKLLADCASHMSMYDTMVYFFSDDIDPASGEIDSNILKFDERDIVKKYENIQSRAKGIREKGRKDTRCDGLLREFHRTIEHGRTAQWEGASVNQVCLAEATTVFVQYQEMAMALVDQTFPYGYNANSEKNWVAGIGHADDIVGKRIAVEAFQCAEELFYRGNRKDKDEEFPFGGCKGKDTHKCSIEKYKFPVLLDVATSDTAMARYETHAGRHRCDKKYEIKDEKECLRAASAMGGAGEVDVRSKSSKRQCFIERKDKKIILSKKFIKNSHVVCKEHINRHEYEYLATKYCEKKYEIKSFEECEEAGLAVGGILRHGRLEVNSWDKTPPRCFMNQDGKIHYNKNTRSKAGLGGYFPICKRKKRDFVVYAGERNGVRKCPAGTEIKNKKDCENAAREMNGRDRGKIFYDGDYGHCPLGCSIGNSDKKTHWNKRNDKDKPAGGGGNKDWRYNPVCKRPKFLNKYHRVGFVKACEPGYEITTIEECATAAMAVGGHFSKYWIDDRDHKGLNPCGCSLGLTEMNRNNPKIFFRDPKKYNECSNRDWSFDLICHRPNSGSSGGGGNARDIYGKLVNNDEPAFITKTYEEIKREGASCVNRRLVKMEEDCLDASDQTKDANYFKCRVEKRTRALEECNRFGPLQKALKLVFGANTSPGFICGITDAVVNDGRKMPGSCCLDAPYELDGDAWGQPFDCESDAKCKNPGPYLAGLNDAACKAQGGTWCPAKADCKALKNCLETLESEAKKEKRLAFEEYIREAPEITNSKDREQCGRTRRYFGFDENFINDIQICEDIEQLKYARDFDFLDEFFKQGSEDSDDSLAVINPLKLTPPSRERSASPPIAKYYDWKTVNFALQVAVTAVSWIYDKIVNTDCPLDWTGIAFNICNKVKDAIEWVLGIIILVLKKIHEVSVNLWTSKSIRPTIVINEENSDVIFENMQKMANYLVEMRKDMSRRNLQQPSTTDEVLKNGAQLDVEIQVLRRSATEGKKLFVLTKRGGVRVDADFKFSIIDENEEEVSLDFNKTVIESGKSIISFANEAVARADFLLVEVSPIGSDGLFETLVSFH